MNVPVNFLFWGSVIALCVQIVEKSVDDRFVNMMKKRFWSDYSGRTFFWFHAVLLLVYIVGIVLYEVLGHGWIIVPLSFAWILVITGFWHVVATGIFREYSPGLITSPIHWIFMYFIMRYNLVQGNIARSHFIISALIGALITALIAGGFFWVSRKAQAKAAKGN